MKYLLSFLLLLSVNLTTILSQTQFFVSGSIQSKGIYQIGLPVVIPLNSHYSFSTGLFYLNRKESETYNPRVIRTVSSSSTGFGGIFGTYTSDFFNAKTYRQNYLSIPISLKYQFKEDRITKNNFFLGAGIAVVYVLNCRVSSYEISKLQGSADPAFGGSRYLSFEKADIQEEGISPFAVEWHCGFGIKLPYNYQASIRFENSLSNLYNNPRGFKRLKNRNIYFSLNVPIFKTNWDFKRKKLGN